MIRLFTILYKVDFERLPSAAELFNTVKRAWRIDRERCPVCTTRGDCRFHGQYGRYLAGIEESFVGRVSVARVICDTCDHTHAILPDVAVPHKPNSILLILSALKESFFHKRTSAEIAAAYGISVSTLYRWRARYLCQRKLKLGVHIEKALLGTTCFPDKYDDICRTDELCEFFMGFGFSFMQYNKATEFSSA